MKAEGIKAEPCGDLKVRSFHKGESYAELRDRLKLAYDAAMRSGLAVMVKQLQVGRNDPCPCESGKKFKKCCLWKCR